MFKVAFLGRGDLGMRVLKGLIENPNVEVPVIFNCRATAEVGQTRDDFQRVADEHGIEYHFTNRINQSKWVEVLRKHDLDLAVAMLWLYIIRSDVIATARKGFVNMHGGMLPQYRGNACANWAILNQEDELGITAHLMTPGELDNGPIVVQRSVPITDSTTVGELTEQATSIGAEIVLEAVELLRTDQAKLVKQNEAEASYCYPRIPWDGEINWHLPAADIERLVRAAGRPYPGAYSYFTDVRDDERIKKLTIFGARIEAHTLNEYYAVPGHLLRLDDERRAVVCGDKQLLVLEDIEIDGEPTQAGEFFTTVRQRLGLDVQSLIAQHDARLRALEERAAQQDAALHGQKLLEENQLSIPDIEDQIRGAVQIASEKLEAAGVPHGANPFRNYSFQRTYFNWEQRERTHGILIYQSLDLDAGASPISLGLWAISDPAFGLQYRLYAAHDHAGAAEFAPAARAAFETEFAGSQLVTFPRDAEAFSGIYAVLPQFNAEEDAQRLERVARALQKAAGG